MPNKIENEVINIVSKETNVKIPKNSKINKSVLKFRWDSLQHIKIIIAIEKKFKVKIGTSVIHKLYDIKSIVNFIKKIWLMVNSQSLLKFNKYKKYYHQVIKNFNSKKLFYRYYNEKKSYKKAYKLLQIIIFFIIKKSDNKKKLNIYVSCDKSFFMYVSILAILLTNNVWIPLSKSLPQNRIREILKSVSPDMFFFDGKDNVKLFRKYTKKIFSFN